MQSHLLLLVLFSLFVAVVFATLLRDEFREQVRLGAMMLGGLAAASIVLGWLMYPFPF